jgi:hypothetical protein
MVVYPLTDATEVKKERKDKGWGYIDKIHSKMKEKNQLKEV